MHSTLVLVFILPLSSSTTTPPLQLALVSPFASEDKTARTFLNSESKKVEDYAPPPPYKAPDLSIYSSPPAPKPSYSPASPSYLEPPPPPPKSPNSSYASPLSLPYHPAEKPNPPSNRAPASFPDKDSKSRAPVVQHPHYHDHEVDLYAAPGGAPDLYGAPPPDPTTAKVEICKMPSTDIYFKIQDELIFTFHQADLYASSHTSHNWIYLTYHLNVYFSATT